MFSTSFKRHAAQFAISAALAAVTPAAAAGLVEGVQVAATTVDQANGYPNAAPDEIAAAAPVEQPIAKIATHEPARLSALAGSDDAAWASAKAVHISHARHPAP